ncbi:unnamed protein product [Arabidopsis halleri]
MKQEGKRHDLMAGKKKAKAKDKQQTRKGGEKQLTNPRRSYKHHRKTT